jgi:hypothetical protein
MIADGRAKRLDADGVDRNLSRPEDLSEHGCREDLADGLEGNGIADEEIPCPQSGRGDPQPVLVELYDGLPAEPAAGPGGSSA